MAKTYKIVIAGEGGQGVQSVAAILSEAAYNKGKEVLYIPNFGVEQRGGVSIAFLQISDERIDAMKFTKADIVIALSGRSVTRTKQYADERTLYIYDTAAEPNEADIPTNAKEVMTVEATNICKRDLHPRVFNVFVMGALLAVTDIFEMDDVKLALEEKLGAKFAKNPALREMNFTALEAGFKALAD